MNTALSQNELEILLDTAVREVTASIAGIELLPHDGSPGGDFCTVYIAFRREFRSSLSLRADTALLTRMAQRAMMTACISAQDLEDFSKEYFNVLCGRIAAVFYRNTKKAARFSVPYFCRGPYEPEGYQRQLVLSYSDEESQKAQLIHHVPCPDSLERAAL